MLRFIALLGALALVVAQPGTALAVEPYVINAVLSQTGPAAFIGTTETKTLKIIEGVVNKQGGVNGTPIRFDIADDGSNPLTSSQLINKIAATNVPVIIGPGFVATCVATMAFTEKNGPLTYCFAPGIRPQTGGYVFASGPDGDSTVATMVRWMRLKGYKRIGALLTTDASGQSYEHGLQYALSLPENRDVTMAALEHMNPTDLSADSQLTRIKAARPDAVMLLATGPAFGTMSRGASDLGLHVPIVVGNGIAVYAQLTQLASVLPDEVYVPGPPALVEGAIGKGPIRDAQSVFFRALKAAGERPDLGWTQAWDPTMLVISALRAVGTKATAQQLHDWIESQQSWAGISGLYDFRDGSQRGVGSRALVMLKYTKATQAFAAVSRPAGYLR